MTQALLEAIVQQFVHRHAGAQVRSFLWDVLMFAFRNTALDILALAEAVAERPPEQRVNVAAASS